MRACVCFISNDLCCCKPILNSSVIYVSFSQFAEVAVLLGLMIGSRAEDFDLFSSHWGGSMKLQLKSDVLLENVRSVLKQMKVRVICGKCVSV